MLTKRRRFFWAAWWSGPPTRTPFRKPDASDGGARTFEEAHRAAEEAFGAPLGIVDVAWARAWNRVLRGEPPWPNGPRSAAPPPPPPADAGARGETAASSLWQVLGVSSRASDEEIKAAFRKKALELHPDQGGEADAFRALFRAYEEARRRARKPRRKTT